MNSEDLMKLVNAGFTKDDIMKLVSINVPDPKEPEKKEDPKEPEKKEEQKDDPMALVKAMIEENKKVLDDIRKASINNDRQPKEEKVDDILASILNPPQDK